MSRSHGRSLEGVRVLILEDEYLLADDLARALRAAGAHPIGPAKSVKHAEDLIVGESPDAAILDLNLHGETASDFIERLSASDVHCLIVSGYGADAVPQSIVEVPRLEKPVNAPIVVDALAAQLDIAR